LKDESRIRRVLIGGVDGLGAPEGIVRKMENLVDEEEIKLSTKDRDELSKVWRILLYYLLVFYNLPSDLTWKLPYV